MKRLLLFCLLSLGAYSVQAQFKLELQGLKDLVLELNDVDTTATICCYDVNIIEVERIHNSTTAYGIFHKNRPKGDMKMIVDVKNRRKLKLFNHLQPNTLIIPSSFEHPDTKVNYTITSIGDAAFAGIYNVSYVSIPSTIKKIGQFAFWGSSLISVNLPSSVKTVGDQAFANCEDLKSLRIPQGIFLGKDLYAESNNVKVTPYNAKNNENIVINDPDMASVPESDVDIDIPYTAQRNEEVFAMIIANEVYNSEAPVQYALHDGKVFKEYCEKVLGLNPKHIYYEENATLGKMNGLMERIVTAADAFDGDARFIVYYAGHGIPDETNNEAYLLPTDGSGQNLKTAFKLKTFYNELGKLNAKNVVVFLDACFSGSQRGNGMLMAARSVAIAPREDGPQEGHTIIFSAASGNETAWPYNEKGHGLFTYFLLKKLRESNGETTLGELDDYIQKGVKRSIPDLEYAKKQTPRATASPLLGNSWRTMKLK